MEQQNEPQMQQINKSVQVPKNILAIVLIIIITALVFGGGVYAWQNSKIEKIKDERTKKVEELQIQITELQNQVNLSEEVILDHLSWACSDKFIKDDFIITNSECDEVYSCFENTKKQKHKCYSQGSDSDAPGGWAYRNIITCKEDVYIIDAADWFGVRCYGPVENE